MTTVIDALVVTLGLDAKGYNQGLKEAEKQQGNLRESSAKVATDLQAHGKQAGQFFSNVKNEALGLIGVLAGTAGIGVFAKQTASEMAALGRSAKNIGLAAPELRAFSNMIARNGGSADAATASLQGYAEAVQAILTGLDGGGLRLGAMTAAGIDVRKDSPLDAYMKFMKYVEANKGSNRGIQEINQIGKLLGYDQGLINAAIQMGSVAKASEEMAQSLRIGVPSQSEIDQVTKLGAAYEKLGQVLTRLGERIVTAFAPLLIASANAATEVVLGEVSWDKFLGHLDKTIGDQREFLKERDRLESLAKTGDSPLQPSSASGSFLQRAPENDLFLQQPSQPGSFLLSSPENGSSVQISSANNSKTGSEAEARAYFKSRGWSEAQATALARVIGHESGHNANAYDPSGGGMGAHGSLQWRGSRIKDYIARYGHGPREGSYLENLDFVDWELRNKEAFSGRGLAKINDVQAGVDFLADNYTRPEHRYPRSVTPPAGQRFAVTPGAGGQGGGTSVTIGTINLNGTGVRDADTFAARISQSLAKEITTQANRGLR